MKKQLLATAVFATLSVSSFADGVFGNQITGSLGYPNYSDDSGYTGVKTDLEFDYFINENVYITGGFDVEYISDEDETLDIELTSTAIKTGIGAGYEMTLVEDEGKQVSVYGEGRIYLVNVELDSSFGGLDLSVSSSGTAIDAEAGVRAVQSNLLSELGLKVQSVSIEDDDASDVFLDAMVGYKLSDSLYVGLDTSVALDFDHSYLSAKLGYQW